MITKLWFVVTLLDFIVGLQPLRLRSRSGVFGRVLGCPSRPETLNPPTLNPQTPNPLNPYTP